MGKRKETGNEVVTVAAGWLDTMAFDATEANRIAFVEWISQDPEHIRQLLELYALQVEARRAAKSSLKLAQCIKPARRVVNFPALPHRYRAAASRNPSAELGSRASRLLIWGIFAALVCYVLLALFLKNQVPRSYETAAGNSRVVELSDGSIVRMSAATRIRVRFGLHLRRIELLEGQAQFDVAPDASRPFDVHSSDFVLRALGTQFTVRRYADSLDVVVTSGHVRFSGNANVGGAVTPQDLYPGQALTVQRRGDALQVHVWRPAPQERLDAVSGGPGSTAIFSDTSLHDAVLQFNRHNARQIVIDDPDLGNLRLGGQFVLANAETFARSMRPFGVEVRADTDGTLHLFGVSHSKSRENPPSFAGVPP